jgi:hypothetical protein
MKIVNRSLAAFAVLFVANIASQSFGRSVPEHPSISAQSAPVMIERRADKN